MPTLDKRWVIREPLPSEIEQELGEHSRVLRQLLYNRGITTSEDARRFLEAEQPPETLPSAMLGIPQAVDRLVFALQKQESIAIYGDYDADGVTATALLVRFLENLGAVVQGYIPHRFDEGYGLNKEALTSLKESGVGLVITVDCGIRSPEEAEHAANLGLDLIISDHHHPGGEMPRAFAVINPKQPGDTYPDKNLAGVGLAFKLAAGLEEYLSKQGDILPEPYQAQAFLDLVALGTVADLAPLTGENRALVRQGLLQIQKPTRQGILSLLGASGYHNRRISSSDLGFILGPRLNAAGRLESAMAALKLLLSQDVNEAGKLALELDGNNRDRQDLTRKTQIQAEEILQSELGQSLLLFAAHPDFNAGIVGLVASRLTEQFYRPAIVASIGPETTRASCRSIPEFHITEALDQCAGLMEHHGGHAAAAGFTVKNENVQILVDRLKQIAFEKLGNIDLQPRLEADMDIPLFELRPEILQDIQKLQPTGQGNPQAAFVSRELKVVRSSLVGKEKSHLKMVVTDGRITYDAIAFRQGYWHDSMPPAVDLLYTFEVNEYNGRDYLQLNVRDIKRAI